MHHFLKRGKIWAPDTKFAEEVIEECAAFPLGEHDDLVDSMTQAVMRFRQGGFVEHPEDYEDEPLPQTTKDVLLMGKVKLGKALAKKLDDFLKEMEVQYKLKPEDTKAAIRNYANEGYAPGDPKEC